MEIVHVVVSICYMLCCFVVTIGIGKYCIFLLFYIYLSFRFVCGLIVCMGNASGLFLMLEGGFGCCSCCGNGGCKGFSGILGVSSRLSDMYLALSVRVCGCLLHGIGQS